MAAFAAMKAGVTPQDIVDRNHKILKETFAGLGIDFNYYGETHCACHQEISQDFFKRLHDHGYVLRRTVEQVYCGECQIFLPDRYVEGVCPFCGVVQKNAARWKQRYFVTPDRCCLCGDRTGRPS